MTRVVVDTNVLVSALLTEHGAEATVLDLLNAGKLYWCISDAILVEYREVLGRSKFAKFLAPKSRMYLLMLQLPTTSLLRPRSLILPTSQTTDF